MEINKDNWEDRSLWKDKAMNMGLSRVFGYYAWFIANGASGHKEGLEFLEDLKQEIELRKRG